MKLWPKAQHDLVQTNLRCLSSKLSGIYKREAKRLIKSPGTLAETDALHIVLQHIYQAKSAIEAMIENSSTVDTEQCIQVLADHSAALKGLIQTRNLDTYYHAGSAAMAVMSSLFLAEHAIGNGHRRGLGEKSEASGSIETSICLTSTAKVRITSDLLYQIRHQLFPPERMLVASGKRGDEGIDIRAVFEVTGQATRGHVRADPNKLGQALIAMDLTETYFALWIHSHPGTGKELTWPSPTDLRQHADWLQHFSPNLVSAIMVYDRWIRFWGDALENSQVSIEVIGAGVQKEATNEAVFRLEY